ncbi:hypothetical protein AJ80_10073 [Polytolypa hystricis UAMH7299]|uniref:Uncharacterized protein n=1 Tax=Polytolypa hystricis (strain UAMH7299) TaxID=1447883 RepID=A0A2B7WEE7_POLH7|nr:hypothetical protein AJ80_10073 [Polytolypa hystricis UAMH7299]
MVFTDMVIHIQDHFQDMLHWDPWHLTLDSYFEFSTTTTPTTTTPTTTTPTTTTPTTTTPTTTTFTTTHPMPPL